MSHAAPQCRPLATRRGRPSGYRKDYAKTAKALCRAGYIDQQLAEHFGVSVSTLKNWKARHPEFLAALKSGKESVDDNVERTLLQRALGYKYDEITVTTRASGKQETRVVTKQEPANVTACIFWLKNRRPADWRDRREVDLSGAVAEVTVDYSNLTDDDLRQAAALARKAGKVLSGSNGNGTVHR